MPLADSRGIGPDSLLIPTNAPLRLRAGDGELGTGALRTARENFPRSEVSVPVWREPALVVQAGGKYLKWAAGRADSRAGF